MKLQFYIAATCKALPVWALCFALTACRSQPAASTPTIVFSQVPAGKSGAGDQTGAIEGHVTGVRPGERIVLYARNDGRWGVQPYSGDPFTKIKEDGGWSGSSQLGSYYAALLAEPGYAPPELTESLPALGNGVAALSIVDSGGTAAVLPQPKTINFSGYEWALSSGFIYRAGSRNLFDPANVWTDANGALHLRISGGPGKWTAAEVKLTRSLGYGTYHFRVRDVSHLEPSAVLTLVSWDGIGTEQNRRELDIELSRWGIKNNDNNAHYVVQPYYVASNILRFRVPAGVLTHSFQWEPGQVTFSTAAGSSSPGTPLLKQHVFSSGVPVAGDESVRISLYVFGKGEPLKNQNEVVIEKFEYLP